MLNTNAKSPAKAPKTTTLVVNATEVNATEVVKLSRAEKLKATIEKYESKKATSTLTLQELKYLLNAKMTLEDKSPSAVFNKLCKNATGEIAELVKEALGKSKMPDYKAFITELTAKNKAMYSNWDGINVLAKFNKAAAIQTKVQSQNKKTAAI